MLLTYLFKVNRRNVQKNKTEIPHEVLNDEIKSQKSSTPYFKEALPVARLPSARDKAQVCAHSGARDTSETGLSVGLEVLETSAAVGGGGEEEGQILPLADMTVPQQQQRQKQKTDRLEVSPAPYLCSAPVEPLRLPLPPRGLHALPSISRFLSPLPVCLCKEVSAAADRALTGSWLSLTCESHCIFLARGPFNVAPRNPRTRRATWNVFQNFFGMSGREPTKGRGGGGGRNW